MKRGISRLLAFMLLFSVVNAFHGGAREVAAANESLDVWTSDSLTKIFQSTVFDPASPQELSLLAARNEYRSGQIVVRSDNVLTNIEVTPSDLVGPNNFTLSNVTVQLVEYLTVRRHSELIDPAEVLYPPDAGSMLYPDPLLPTSQLAELPANTTQPFWYKAFVPGDAPAGDYYGTVSIAADQAQYTVNVHLRVYDVTVPELADSEYLVDNWLVSAGWAPHGVAAIDYQYGIEQWSDEWWTLMSRFADYMADHRNNVLWLSPIAYLQQASHIDDQGNIAYDWTLFDRFVQMFKNTGAGKYLHGVSLLLGKNADDRFVLSILANENGEIVQKLVTVDDPRAEAFLNDYLPALAAHLYEKGWLDTFIQSGGDEPRSNQDNADNNWVYDKIHALTVVEDSSGVKHGIKTADAQVIRQEQSQSGLDVFIVKQDVFDLNQSFHKEMQRLGKELWLYICNYPQGKYLNRLFDMHLTKTLLPHWYTYKNGMTGYLHYGFNIWAPEPISIGKNAWTSSETGMEYWAPARAVDGIVSASTSNLGWSSAANASPDGEEWIVVDLGQERVVRKAAILPRIDGNNFGYGYPVDFTIETYDSASDTWVPQVTKTNFPKPEKTTFVSSEVAFELPKTTTQYVRLKATKLGCGSDECADYRLQISELEIIGEDDVVHESDYGSPGDAWLVYPDRVNLDVMSSMRSEVQLEGIQDYELFKLLEDGGKGEFARKIVESIIKSGTNYNREADAIIAARKAVLDLLTDQYTLSTFVDPLDNMDLIAEHSEHLGMDSSNPGNANGDTGRIARTGSAGSEDQYFIYRQPDMRGFEAQLYTDTTDQVEVFASADNSNWKAVAIQKSELTPTGYWYGFTISADRLPAGAQYLKIVIKATNENSWTPQIGEVKIHYGFEVNEKDSLIDNNGFEAGLWAKHAGAAIDSSVKHTGKHSAKLTAAGQPANLQSEVASIGAGQKISFSIQLKTEGITAADGVKVELMQVDENGHDIGLYAKNNGRIATGGTHDWQEFNIDHIDTEAAGLRVIVRVQDGVEGTVWVDDVILLESPFIQTYVDYLDDMSGLYANSALLGLDTSGDPVVFGGDNSRLARFENSDQYFVYNKPLISAFSLKAYTATTAEMKFYASSDNVNWTPVRIQDSARTDTQWGWFSVTKAAEDIPRNTNYMKVVIPGTNDNSWSPQIGEVSISYGYEKPAPDSLLVNSGFETGLWEVSAGANLDAEVFHSGSHSAKLVANERAAAVMSSEVLNTAQGKDFSLSLWLRTENISDAAGVKVDIMQVDDFGNDVGLLDTGNQRIAAGGTSPWTAYTVEHFMTSAPGIRLIVRTTEGTTGTAWIDDVVVTNDHAIFTDTLNNMSLIYEKSANLGLDSSNAEALANGDASRIARTDNSNGYLVYHVTGMLNFLAKFYSQDNDMKVDFHASPDNSAWEQLAVHEDKSLTPNGWTNNNVSVQALPAGTNYLKILIRDDNSASWTPQLGEVTIAYGSGEQKPSNVSLIRNSGFELGVWPNNAGASLESSDKHSGYFSAKLASAGQNAYMSSSEFEIDPSKPYGLALWAKTADGSSHSVIEVMQLDEDGDEIGLYAMSGGTMTIAGSQQWKRHVFAPLGDLAEGTAALKVTVRSDGTLWLDDFVLRELVEDVNEPPAATADIIGIAKVGETLTGSYTFSDPNPWDTEGTSHYRWLISSTEDGTYTAISGATGLTYVPVKDDLGKYVRFEVTPVDRRGLEGAPAVSQATAAIAAKPATENPGGTIFQPISDDSSVQQVTEAELRQANGTLSLQSGKDTLSLPVNAGDLLQSKLIVKAGEATVTIAASVLKALQEQANKETLDAVSIIVKIVPMPYAEDTGDSALQAGGTVYSLELYAVNGQGKTTRLGAFQDSVRIELPYLASQNAALIGIYYYNEASGKWEYVGGTVDAEKRTISVEVRHFSQYAVMAYDKTFVDVPQKHWAFGAIQALAAKHVVTGVDDSRFNPNGLTSRAEFTAMLVRALGIAPSSAATPFKDIASGKWYAESVQAAYEAGLVQGVSEERFAPEAQITREQMAILIVRAAAYAGRTLEPVNAGLSGDVDKGKVSGWAAASVDQAIQSGLMQGKGNGAFHPQDRVTRAETAQAIWNLVK